MKKNKSSEKSPRVAIIMGSDSDWPVMKKAKTRLDQFGIESLHQVVSAHRTPEDLGKFAVQAEKMGIQVIIAGAGGAAHLPGMIASYTKLPVIGVPIVSTKLNGMDSLLSIVQMPEGIPVATMAVENAGNAGIFAARILSLSDSKIEKKLKEFRGEMAKTSREKTKKLT